MSISSLLATAAKTQPQNKPAATGPAKASANPHGGGGFTQVDHPIEQSSLSPGARRALAEDQAQNSYDQGVTAFGKLNERDRSELSALIQKRLDFNGAESLSQDQANDIRAQVASEWATSDKMGGNRAILELNRSAHAYQDFRQQAADLGGTPVYQEPQPRKLEDFIHPGSEEAADTRSSQAFATLLEGYNKLPAGDRRSADAQVGDLIHRWEKKFGPATQADINDLSAEFLGKWARGNENPQGLTGNVLSYLIARRDHENDLGGPLQGSALEWILAGPNGTGI